MKNLLTETGPSISHFTSVIWHLVKTITIPSQFDLARTFHELLSRDREDGRATGQPQGLESEAYLNSTSQGSRSEDARKDGHIHGRSSRIVKYPG
jgi:hypothetical protein